MEVDSHYQTLLIDQNSKKIDFDVNLNKTFRFIRKNF